MVTRSDAKNPEGVLAEALTLSGFSTLLALRPESRSPSEVSQSPLGHSESDLELPPSRLRHHRTPESRWASQRAEEISRLSPLLRDRFDRLIFRAPNLANMADREKITGLGRLLARVAREHHEATGGAPDHWAEWYADRLQGEIDPWVGFEPTVAQIEGWLGDADERFREENPEVRWPFFYAELILVSHSRDS